jgi:hypothetical protein
LDPWDVSDLNGPAGDLDNDGMNNLQEYRAGTNPRDSQSRLEIAAIAVNEDVVLTFQAVSNRLYTVEFTDSLGAPWQSLTVVALRPTNHTATVTDAPLRTNRFYRLQTSEPLN